MAEVNIKLTFSDKNDKQYEKLDTLPTASAHKKRQEGDYIEIGQLGAYALTFRTKFNGFYSDKIFEVQDSPIMSMYEKDSSSRYLVA